MRKNLAAIFAGTGTGTFNTDTLAFTYDFTVNPFSIGSFDISDYDAQVSVLINGSSGGSTKFSGLFGEQQTGGFDVNVPNGQGLSTWAIVVLITANDDKQKIHLNIPKNSVDLTGKAPTTVVPEPAPVALAACGLLLVGLAARRRRQ